MVRDRSTSPEDGIRRTIALFCHRTDAGDYDGWADLFTQDGRFRVLGGSFVGRAALRLFIADDQPPERRGMHLTTDSVIDLRGDVADVRSNFVFIAAGETGSVIVASGRYQDVMVPVGDEWLFREREAVLVGPVTTQPWGRRRP